MKSSMSSEKVRFGAWIEIELRPRRRILWRRAISEAFFEAGDSGLPCVLLARLNFYFHLIGSVVHLERLLEWKGV